MSLISLRNEIHNLRSYTASLGDSLGNSIWRQSFTRMLDQLERTLRDFEDRIDDLELEIE